ncbi:hypothetical protein [Xanthobacter autotrophicus]|uniref:hypothetical protein n=1 Tax=Xanthobacter autotrophicus TaxID=280 RepID=UPI0024A6BD25|nr:hypothetical protein [Xanthobacter autotrophicus]MDI4655534.1 hypothetical protein [Xanthobacter autotrophicus]
MSEPSPTRRALLKGAAITGAALLTMPGAGSTLEPDPVFAAIAAHQEVIAGLKVALDRFTIHELAGGKYDAPEIEAAVGAAHDRDFAGLWGVIDTVPTTAAGVAAYIDHLTGKDCFGGVMIEEAEFQGIMTTLRAFAAKGAAA